MNIIFAAVMMVVVMTQLSTIGAAREFRFLRATDTTACVHYRNSATDDWGYLYPNQVTQESAEYFCRTYYPASISGVITLTNSNCEVSDVYRYAIAVDCPYNSTTDADCTIDTASASYVSESFYAAAIKCLVAPDWGNLGSPTTFPLLVGGTYGTPNNRTVSVEADFTIGSVRPDSAFAYGTICLPPSGTFDANVTDALCRSADLTTSNASTSNGTFSSSQRYFSNITCSDSSTATLFNGGCTNTTHYYDAPTTECSTLRPRLSCPSTFDVKLSDPNPLYDYFQLLEVRPHNTSASQNDEYNGTICVDYSYKYNFARAMCLEMYGSDNTHFATVKQYYRTSSEYVEKQPYLHVNRCTVSTSTTLAQCTGISRPSSRHDICSYQTGISCRMDEKNTLFSLLKDGDVSALPGHGYLVASVTNIGATSRRYVCSNGFNQAAALATCRSIGYTPGPSATFSIVATAPSSHIINNVNCPTGANKMTDCKLQYSGSLNVLSTTDAAVCGGKVLIDCDLGTPMAEFRTTVSDRLQVRLYPNSSWGWVRESTTDQKVWNTMCNKNTSTGGDDDIEAEYLYVRTCGSSDTSYLQCTYEYSEGAYSQYRHRCNNPGGGTSSSSSSISKPDLEVALGVGIGVPVGIAFLVFIICFSRKQAAEKEAKRAENLAKLTANSSVPPPTKTPAELMEERMMAAANSHNSSNNSFNGKSQKLTKKQRKAQRKAEEEAAQFGGGGGQFVYGNDPSAAPGSANHPPFNAWQGAPQEMATGIPMHSFQPQPSPYPPPQAGPPLYNHQAPAPMPYGGEHSYQQQSAYVQPPPSLYNNEAAAFQHPPPQQVYGAENNYNLDTTPSPYQPQGGGVLRVPTIGGY